MIHLGALSNDPLGDLDPELTYDINLSGSLRFAQLAKEAGVERFLFASSCSNYGAAGDAILDENATLSPITPYAISKVKLEQALSKLADDRFSPAYLRNATAYGVSPRLRVDIVLNNLVAWAVTTGKIVLQSDGSPWRPIVHAEDIGRAFLLFLGASREPSTTRRTTSVRRRRTTGSASWRRSSARRSRAARSRSPRAPGPTRATTGSRRTSWRRPFPASS